MPCQHLSRAVLLLATVSAGLGAGCVSKRVESGSGGGPSAVLAPALVVERFLRAANAVAQRSSSRVLEPDRLRRELETMGRLFGTHEGALLERDPRQQVEQRMATLASILQHEDYVLDGPTLVPGRSSEAVEIVARLRIRGLPVAVPFTVVRSGKDAWLVEKIDIEKITGRRPGF